MKRFIVLFDSVDLHQLSFAHPMGAPSHERAYTYGADSAASHRTTTLWCDLAREKHRTAAYERADQHRAQRRGAFSHTDLAHIGAVHQATETRESAKLSIHDESPLG